jgi:hypothetical protein
MNSLLIYLLKSSLCMSLLYLLFRTVMRKESFFALNRMLLLLIVLFSFIIPILYLPSVSMSSVKAELLPVFAPSEISSFNTEEIKQDLAKEIPTSVNQMSYNTSRMTLPSLNQMFQYVYLSGLLMSFLLLLNSMIVIIRLLKMAKYIKMDGFRLLILEKEISAFSFGRLVILSQKDYDEHQQTLLAHEHAHIRFKHFYDLLFLETAKTIHWFNPCIYWIVNDMKEIHEFQADDYTINKGIDATQYQLLIIQKCVGSQRFALANSFNHGQIKKRIEMMNNQKSGKTRSWKVVAFLPLLALLLMAFSRRSESEPAKGNVVSSIGMEITQDSGRQWCEADFLSTHGLTTFKGPDFGFTTKDGKTVTQTKSQSDIFKHWTVQIDSKSQIWMGYHAKQLNYNELKESIKTHFDCDFANEETIKCFSKRLVNGIEIMSPKLFFEIVSDRSTPEKDYQKLLNVIGNTILEIRGKYSNIIFKQHYTKLAIEQKQQIDTLIPLIAEFWKTPVLQQEAIIKEDSLINRYKQSENIAFQADKIVMDPNNPSIIFLHQNAHVRYKDLEITADYIELNKDSSLLHAVGKRDSSGTIKEKPVLKIGKDVFSAAEINYNIKTKKGFVSDVNTPVSGLNEKALLIEVRVEGIVVSPKHRSRLEGYAADDFNGYIVSLEEHTSTLDKLRDEVIKFAENNLSGLIRVLVANGSSDKLLNEVKKVVSNSRITNIKYSTFDPIYAYAEQKPEFPGGNVALNEWNKQHIKYSGSSHAQTPERCASVNFVVDRNGKITVVKLAGTVNPKLDADVEERVANLTSSFKAMPNWIPGKQNGTPVRVLFGLSIYY